VPAQIRVERVHGETYQVVVSDGGKRTTHTVEVDPAYHRELTGGAVTPDVLIRKSFEFLLEREPQESILASFTLSVIRRYFPEYENEIRRRVRAGA
jgi:hypothetical protein